MNLIRAAATVGGFTLLSRGLGLVREILIAALLGAGSAADAFFVAFRLPNLFRRFFAEGAFNMAFVPLFAKRLEGDASDPRADARDFAEEVLGGLLSVVFVLTLAAQLFMPWVIYAIAAGFAQDPDKLALAVTLATIQFPYLIFMSLVALFAGVLNSLGKFAAAAGAPILLNLCMIAALGLAYGLEQDVAVWVSWSVFVAGVLQFYLVSAAARRAGFGLALRRPRWTPGLKRLVVLGAPGLFVGGVTQINILIGTLIASFYEGAVTWLTLADRLYNLPLGVVGVALGVALLPDLSRRIRAGDQDGALSTLRRATLLSFALGLPAAAGLAVLAEPLMAMIFERGAYTAADVAESADALALFALGLPAYILIKALSPAYFANEDTKTPLYYAIIATALATAISVGLAPFIEWRGVPIGTAVGAWVNVVLLEYGLRRRGVSAVDGWVLGRGLRAGLAAAAMVAALEAGRWALGGAVADPLLRFPATLGLVALGVAVYGAAALALGAVTKGELRALRRRPA